MLEREFIVRADSNGLELYDYLDVECAKSICENELEIPEECIKKIECYDNAFKIYLAKSRRYYSDDWYINLQRLDYVS
ncbi:hypothetical protein KJ877_00775 [bacterium]|nr:hypothetical protein [bacterium]MBU1989561.1 hypothetical protein [bacterium]